MAFVPQESDDMGTPMGSTNEPAEFAAPPYMIVGGQSQDPIQQLPDDPNDGDGDDVVLDDIEKCELIEDVNDDVDLRTNLTDCPGFCPAPPFWAPNTGADPDTIVKAINHAATDGTGKTGCAQKCCVGRMVPRGHIGIYEHNGVIFAVGQGYWQLGMHRASWIQDWLVSLDQSVIERKTLLIVRVPLGNLGLVTINGNPEILGAGVSVFNKGTAKFQRFEIENNPYIQCGPYHILRVPRGKYGKVFAPTARGNTLVPRFLEEGPHMIKSIHFRYEGDVNVGEEYVAHGSIHILQVKKGYVAKVFHENRPRLLGRGRHCIESTNFRYCGLASLADNIIQHGTMTIFRVKKGDVGVAWEYNQPRFIEKEGLYFRNSPNFIFVEHKSRNDRIISLGAKKIIMVYTGEVGVAYDGGELRILEHGRHQINEANIIFEGFQSTQQKSIRLLTISSDQKNRKKAAVKDKLGHEAPVDPMEDLLICETKDLVRVGCRADVFYSVKDPHKALSTINQNEIEDMVRETAVATLTNILRSTALNEIAQSKLPSVRNGENEKKVEEPVDETLGSAPRFFDKAHDEFLSKLHDDFMARYGIEIANIRIENFKIMDDELADSISKQALVTANTENELANLEGNRQIATQKQHRDAEVMNIKAEAEARALKTEADAKNQRMIAEAEAEAQARRKAILLEAQAEAEAVRIKAEADADSIRKIADAEAQRAEALGKTELGKQSTLLKIYSDMVCDTNKGVEKVYYCDPSLSKDGNPFQMPALLNINRDLTQLSGVGDSKLLAGEDQYMNKQIGMGNTYKPKSGGNNIMGA